MTPMDDDDVLYPDVGVYLAFHAAAATAFWSGVTTEALALCGTLYVVRMFAICAGYHRYFSHRAYSTSRVFQFVLAALAQSSGQKSVLWWAAKHREHHLHSDDIQDTHSPRHRGLCYAHVGWIFMARHESADLSKVKDLAAYSELLLLHRFEKLPAIVLALLCFWLFGWSGLIVGFVWSTILLYHATFCINSIAHMHGEKRYVTGDDSRNHWLLALVTLGEGWHNNHHAYPASARQGFRWWEFDATYYLLLLLERAGIIWDLKHPPASVLRNERALGIKVIERAARQLASAFEPENMRSAEGRYPRTTEGCAPAALKTQQAKAREGLRPTDQELRRCAAVLFPPTPSLEKIIEAARRVIGDAGKHVA
jgi:stearoyl-CoA desaturase (delta-9 desaturase)